MAAVTLYLMTQKGYEVLKKLVPRFGEYVSLVVTARDSSVQKDFRDEIEDHCQKNGIRCVDRKDPHEVTNEYALAVSWRWLIALPATRLIVFHDSLLPRYRGFNPLVSCLINGEGEIGVTALFAAKEYDRGEVIRQEAIPVRYPIKIQEAIEEIVVLYGAMAFEILQDIVDSKPLPTNSQDESAASYSLWRNEDDYRIDWSWSSRRIRRFIDAVGFPYKGASTFAAGRKLRVTEAVEIDEVKIENRVPGKIIFLTDGLPVVVCGRGLLQIKEIIEDETGSSLIPWRKFRTRFAS